jgi:hypothetical protein
MRVPVVVVVLRKYDIVARDIWDKGASVQISLQHGQDCHLWTGAPTAGNCRQRQRAAGSGQRR